MAPSNVQEDNDAALRASLTTLLSCAAAARGLSKSKEEAEAPRAARTVAGPSNQPMQLRLVPEAELMEESSSQEQSDSAPQALKRRGPSAKSPSGTDISAAKPKRSSSAGRQPRASKKKKTTNLHIEEEAIISPTLLTWAVSAGVIILISVVGFGAGYVIGREVGRHDGLSTSVIGVNDTSSCGKEAMRSSSSTLRRFKWSAVGKTITASS